VTGSGGAETTAGLRRGNHDCAENGSAAILPRTERAGIPGGFACDAATERSGSWGAPDAGAFAEVGAAGPRRSIATQAAAPASSAIKTAILGGRRILALMS